MKLTTFPGRQQINLLCSGHPTCEVYQANRSFMIGYTVLHIITIFYKHTFYNNEEGNILKHYNFNTNFYVKIDRIDMAQIDICKLESNV